MSSIQLLDKTRKIGRLLHNNNSSKVVFNDICDVLGDILRSNVLVISKKGKVLGIGARPTIPLLNNLIEKTKATVLIVAQRISSIRNADRIIVLDEGKIKGIGSHEQLMKTCELYQEIARSQLSEEEL